MPRADLHNTGHQPQAGSIQDPVVKTRVRLGGALAYVIAEDVTGDDQKEVLYLNGGRVKAVAPDQSPIWRSSPINPTDILGVYDLDENGEREVILTGPTSVIVLAGSDGRTLWQQEFALATSTSWIQVAKVNDLVAGLQMVVWPYTSPVGHAFAFDLGVASGRLMWSTPPDYADYPYQPEIIVGDVRGTGRNDLMMAGYGTIRAYDGRTGQTLTTAKDGFNGRVDYVAGPNINGRNYGQFQLVQGVNQRPLLVMVADGVCVHIEVIQSDPTGLRLLHDKFIEFPENQKALRTTVHAVGDLENNGRIDIAVSMWNDTADRRWHTLVYDAVDGCDAEARPARPIPPRGRRSGWQWPRRVARQPGDGAVA